MTLYCNNNCNQTPKKVLVSSHHPTGNPSYWVRTLMGVGPSHRPVPPRSRTDLFLNLTGPTPRSLMKQSGPLLDVSKDSPFPDRRVKTTDSRESLPYEPGPDWNEFFQSFHVGQDVVVWSDTQGLTSNSPDDLLRGRLESTSLPCRHVAYNSSFHRLRPI